jgi:hypothetical protein
MISKLVIKAHNPLKIQGVLLMKNKKLKTAAVFFCFIAFCGILVSSLNAEGKINFSIIFIDGPDPGNEGKKMVGQLISILARLTGIKQDTMQGEFFNSIDAAKQNIASNNNSFIMGSLGFYLSNRKALKLVPLATVKILGSDREQFFLIVKKDRYKSLKDLKGKSIYGSVLNEDRRFIKEIILPRDFDISSLKLQPTSRPLTAVRKVAQGEYDAVLLNQMQYQSSKRLSVFKNLEVVYSSRKMPTLGLMMVDTPETRSKKDKLVVAVTKMCSRDEGKEVCRNFGIDGFEACNAEQLKEEITRFEGTN